jgi:uncharacterized protein (TIGR03067 family)
MSVRFIAFVAVVIMQLTQFVCAQTREPLPPSPTQVEWDPLPPEIVRGSAELQTRRTVAGTWRATYFEYEGQPRPDIASTVQMRFTRGALELSQNGRPPITVAYELDTQRIPAGFSWTYLGSRGIVRQYGVYWLKGDQLVICLGAINTPAPTEFFTQAYDRKTLFVLQRVP